MIINQQAEEHRLRGVELMDEKRYDEALEEYARALEIQDDYARVYYNRANLYMEMEAYDSAINGYGEAIRFSPADQEPQEGCYYANRAACYSEIGKHDEAVFDLNKAIELNPDCHAYWYNRGIAYEEIEDYDKALGDYRQACELDPGSELYKEKRVSMEEKAGSAAMREASITIKDIVSGFENQEIDDENKELLRTVIQKIYTTGKGDEKRRKQKEYISGMTRMPEMPPPLPGAVPPPLPIAASAAPPLLPSVVPPPLPIAAVPAPPKETVEPVTARDWFVQAHAFDAETYAEKPVWENIRHFMERCDKATACRLEGLKQEPSYERYITTAGACCAKAYTCFNVFEAWLRVKADKAGLDDTIVNIVDDVGKDILQGISCYSKAIELKPQEGAARRERAKSIAQLAYTYNWLDSMVQGTDAKEKYTEAMRLAVKDFDNYFKIAPEISAEDRKERDDLWQKINPGGKKRQKGFLAMLFGGKGGKK